MVRKKAESKRMSYKTKYKIVKKAKEQKKKERREARKNPHKRTKLKKDPGIPNLYPYKQALLSKMKIDEEKEREQRRQDSINGAKRARGEFVSEFDEMRQDALKKQRKHEHQMEMKERAADEDIVNDTSRKSFYKEFKTVVKASDVILQVLDARDPIGTRSVIIENQIRKLDPNKKIVLVLNKIDLVPKENVEAWLSYLRNQIPTVAFKASTQKQRNNMGISSIRKYGEGDLSGVSECLGAPGLISLLKNYSRSFNVKKAITVGIIGFPNVGKSSLINSLKRSKVVGVGATPGFTKTTQTISLDSTINLLDCPGIIFDPGLISASDAALRNCIKFEQITDPLLPIEAILKRCNRDNLMELYKIGMYSNPTEFLSNVAQKRGKLKQGGVTDINAAAKLVLLDWNTGKIPYYTLPPTEKHFLGAEIVDSFSAEFNMDEIMEIEREMLDTLNTSDYGFSAVSADQMEVQDLGEFINFEESDDEVPEVVVNIKKKNQPLEERKKKVSNTSLNKEMKNIISKKKKNTEDPQEEQSFNFGTDFWGNYDGEIKEAEEDDDMIDAFTF
eukprot:TRINITY_DN8437_c0_g1_i1.p1 TRINITY_DN8437_c0_g1~~TRINITY_DN8437_c0_g1_i1.p1  ORF type:complete len:560 (-),score=174.44 TRINITY_DN8437_c0_g1_i1:60-1739(-)